MLVAVKVVSALAIAVWLGAMIFFSAGVAPVAFQTLPSRELAGNVVNGAMRHLHGLAYGAGGLLLLTLALRAGLGERRLMAAKAGLAALMLGIALYSGFGLSAPLAEIRARVGTLDKLPETDPVRERFNRMHKLSVTLMGVNILLAVALVAMEQVPARRPT